MDNLEPKKQSVQEIIESNQLEKISGDIYRVGTTGWIFRDRDSSSSPTNIARFELFLEITTRFHVLTGFQTPEYRLEKGLDVNGDERLLLLVKEVQGIHLFNIANIFESTSQSEYIVEKAFQVLSNLLDYYQACFKFNLPMIPDLKLAQFVIEEGTGIPFMVDLDLPVESLPYPIYIDKNVHPRNPEIYYYKLVNDYLRFVSECKDSNIPIPEFMEKEFTSKIQFLNLNPKTSNDFQKARLIEMYWARQLAIYQRNGSI